jgi:YD repeat-containing protein
LVRERSREGATLDYAYDEWGNLARVTGAGGREVRFAHDTQGRLLAALLPDPELRDPSAKAG